MADKIHGGILHPQYVPVIKYTVVLQNQFFVDKNHYWHTVTGIQ